MNNTYFFRPILALWKTLAELAAELGEEYVNVQQWHYRDSIPPQHYGAIVEAAQRRIESAPDEETAEAFQSITIERLASLARDKADKRKQGAAA